MLPYEAWWNLLLQSLVHIDFVYNNPRGILNRLCLCWAHSRSLTGRRRGNASLQTATAACFPPRTVFCARSALLLWLVHWVLLHFVATPRIASFLRMCSSQPRQHKYWFIISQHMIKLYQLLVEHDFHNLNQVWSLYSIKSPMPSLESQVLTEELVEDFSQSYLIISAKYN